MEGSTILTGFRSPPDPGNDPLLSTGELADYLSCSLTFARKLLDEGTLPSVKLAGIRRVRRSDVNRLVSGRLEAPPRRSAEGGGS